jgi:SAM-dependent methyltransferase
MGADQQAPTDEDVQAGELTSSFPPGLPPDYYERLFAVEENHWWYRGMRRLFVALLRDRLRARDLRLLDAGCGAGGWVKWATGQGSFSTVVGADFSEAALELARRRAPGAELVLAPMRSLPFADDSFDVATLNDVLQHIHEDELEASLAELRRVLAPDGALFIRTNSARVARRERDDWRVYDQATLRRQLESAGFSCARLTHANIVGSAWAALRGRSPRAPTEERAGIPSLQSLDDSFRSRLMGRLLQLEARYLQHGSRSLPFGHTLLAVATPFDYEEAGAAALTKSAPYG